MAARIHRVDYFYAAVQDAPGHGYRVLTALAEKGVNLLAFNAIPMGPEHTQLVLFADDADRLRQAAEDAGLQLTGPQRALLVQGDDELGALAAIHRRLADADVNVFASTGVTDGKGGFGYVVHVRPDDFDAAVTALGV